MTEPRRPADTHVHTRLCRHATGEPAEYVLRAGQEGLAALGFTDHVPAPDGYDPACRMGLAEFPEYLAILEGARRDAPLPILAGIEADYYPGALPFLTGWLREQPFDMVLGSVHYIADWAFDNPAEAAAWESVELPGAWRQYFGLVAALADTRLFDVMAHLDLPKLFGHRLPDPVMREIAAPALDRVAAAGMAVELNTAGLRRAAREIYPSPLLLAMARKRGIPILFGSDAHCPGDVGRDFDLAVALARDVGYTEYAVYSARRRRMVPLPSTSPEARHGLKAHGGEGETG